MSVFKYTSQEIAEYRDRHDTSMHTAVDGLKKRDLLAAVEEFRRDVDTDLLADILSHFVETAL